MSGISLDQVILDATTSNIAISDGTDTLAINGDGSLNAVVTATDLDIRDLTHVSDSIQIGDGTDFLAINADGSINVNLTDDGIPDGDPDAGNPLKVGGYAQALSSPLTFVDDGDRFDLTGDVYRRLVMNDAYNIGWQVTSATVGTTEVQLAPTALAGRQEVIIQNVSSNRNVYVRALTGVTTANGIKIPANGSATLRLGQALSIYAIADGAGADVRILEGA